MRLYWWSSSLITRDKSDEQGTRAAQYGRHLCGVHRIYTCAALLLGIDSASYNRKVLNF